MRKAIVPHLRGRGIAVDDLGIDGTDAGGLSGHRRAGRAAPWREARPTPASSSTAPGIGSAIAANKVRGIRAAMIADETIARYARAAQRRQRDDARLVAAARQPDGDFGMVDIWLGTAMTEARYIRRLMKVRRLEENF